MTGTRGHVVTTQPSLGDNRYMKTCCHNSKLNELPRGLTSSNLKQNKSGCEVKLPFNIDSHMVSIYIIYTKSSIHYQYKHNHELSKVLTTSKGMSGLRGSNAFSLPVVRFS